MNDRSNAGIFKYIFPRAKFNRLNNQEGQAGIAEIFLYIIIFRSLKDNANDLNVVLSPELVTCEFESGLIASIRLEFPTASIRGCYFHFLSSSLSKSTSFRFVSILYK